MATSYSVSGLMRLFPLQAPDKRNDWRVMRRPGRRPSRQGSVQQQKQYQRNPIVFCDEKTTATFLDALKLDG